MALYIRNAAFAVLIATALGMTGTSAGGAMPINDRLATMTTKDSDVEQVRVVRRYGYARPYYRRYGYARPLYRYGYVRNGPAYYYGAPYSYGRPYYYGGPIISFGFGPRFWW